MAGFIETTRKEPVLHSSANCTKDDGCPCCEGGLRSRIFRWGDFAKISTLMLLAIFLGIYMISTTVMISKDGAFYIDRAQQLAQHPIKIIQRHPPGYPFLILVAHKFTTLFNTTPSVFTWIYSAQGVALLCRVLAIIPLYFIGKLLVGGKNSFWAMLILTFLPFSTKFVCDAVREWPYLLFLATGFLLLLWGARYGKFWVMGLVGLNSGVGYLIRPESLQLVLYSLLWIVASLLRPRLWGVSRWKSFIALAMLLIGFAIPAGPYIKCTGEVLPRTVKHAIKNLSFNASPGETDEPKVSDITSNYTVAAVVPGNFLKALHGIFDKFGENLMWFFMPALVIGLYYQLRGRARPAEVFLITTFILVSVTVMVLRYCYVEPAISKRWNLPLVVFTVFYVPVGLRVVGNWLGIKLPINRQLWGKKISWFLILLLIGLAICVPKIFRPIRREKQGYLDAAAWLGENSQPKDLIATLDRRIAFYAERSSYTVVVRRTRFLVKIFNTDKPELVCQKGWQQRFATWADKREKTKRIIVFEKKR